ncbi:GDCCVxC domain-containing (seleno)protein [Deinococcus sp. VB343]
MALIRQSTLRCPHCQQETELEMPTNACQFFFTCPACDVLLKPLPGDCCVFCSFGTVPCPPMQQDSSCC